MQRLSARPDACTACGLCLMLCAYHQTGGFNPRHALIEIPRDALGVPVSIAFTHGCETQPVSPCARMTVPACVSACAFEAIVLTEAASCTE